MHYTGKAIADYNMIQTGDRVLVCVSGGKDSLTLFRILHLLQMRTNNKFQIFGFILDQAQPGWNDDNLKSWFAEQGVSYEILRRDTYSIVKDKLPSEKTPCSLCSRLRRGIIYRYAKDHRFTKIALGHHRDDLIASLLMSVFYNGQVKSMPPKLLTDDKKNIVIRPLAYCQEKDIIAYAKEKNFPITNCGFCGGGKELTRGKTAKLIKELAAENPKVPSNILRALQMVKPSQLMDRELWDFNNLENLVMPADTANDVSKNTVKDTLAERYFRGEEGYNCAQAVLKVYQEEFNITQDKIEEFKAFGGGCVKDGICGALFSANELYCGQADKEEACRKGFLTHAGSVNCKEIRKLKQLSCLDCVKLSIRLINDLRFPPSFPRRRESAE